MLRSLRPQSRALANVKRQLSFVGNIICIISGYFCPIFGFYRSKDILEVVHNA